MAHQLEGLAAQARAPGDGLAQPLHFGAGRLVEPGIVKGGQALLRIERGDPRQAQVHRAGDGIRIEADPLQVVEQALELPGGNGDFTHGRRRAPPLRMLF